MQDTKATEMGAESAGKLEIDSEGGRKETSFLALTTAVICPIHVCFVWFSSERKACLHPRGAALQMNVEK